MASSKIYFYRNGVELTDHPANGMDYTGCGPFIAEIGKHRVHRSVFVGKGYGRNYSTYIVNECDFDGPVMVKVWAPGIDKRYIEWFALAELETATARGGKPSGHVDNFARDGRGVEFQGWAPFEECAAKIAG